MSNKLKSETKEQITLTLLLDLLKELELTYYLSTKIDKKSIKRFKKEILRIVNDLR